MSGEKDIKCKEDVLNDISLGKENDQNERLRHESMDDKKTTSADNSPDKSKAKNKDILKKGRSPSKGDPNRVTNFNKDKILEPTSLIDTKNNVPEIDNFIDPKSSSSIETHSNLNNSPINSSARKSSNGVPPLNISPSEMSIRKRTSPRSNEKTNPEDVESSTSVTEDDSLADVPNPLLPKRYVLLFMLFLGFAVVYSLRVNINVAIVAMVNNRTKLTDDNKVIYTLAEFDWNSKTQALVIGSFYYGYWVLQVPGAWIAMKMGATRIFGYGVFLSSILALITPVGTRYHVMALVGIRIFQGVFLSVTFPCVIAIWAKWAPPLERSTMVTMAIAGSPVGNIFAIPITGMLSKYGFDGGWPSVFYVFGFIGIGWFILWEFVIYDTPATHPTISLKEKTYIEKSICEKPFDPLEESPPWRAIFTSIPMWGIIIGHFGACWGYYTLFTQMPTYLKDIQHLDIKTMGLVAALPYLCKAFLGPMGGISADLLLRYNLLTVRGVRILFYAIGNICAGFFILMCGYFNKQGQAIAFLILGVGFSGLNATGYAVNHLDLAPRYAGILMGVSNTFATIPGFLSPLVTGYIAKTKKASEWKIVFWITFIIYIISTMFYTLMCTGERQWWAEGYPKDDTTSTVQTSDMALTSQDTSTTENDRTYNDSGQSTQHDSNKQLLPNR